MILIPYRCKYCETDAVFKTYETKLFRFENESNSEEKQDKTSFKTYMRRGINSDGDLEIIMKFFLNLCRHIKGISFFFFTSHSL